LAIEKGLRTLLMAWRDLADIPLVIVGDGPLRAELEAYARDHKLHQVTFVGLKSREETRRLVADAALQVVPSEWFEGMPMVVLEAWSAGTPVIASAIGGLAEMIGNDERGLSFRTQDSGSLVRQVRHLWRDTERRNELAAAGRDQIARHHTPEAGLRSLNAIYAELVT
jgi:glycosyltransferase involved in cell wall biosynthesis